MKRLFQAEMNHTEETHCQELIVINDKNLLVNVASIRKERGMPGKYFHISTDVTPLKKVQEELAETSERLRTLIDTLPDFVIYKDGEGRWIDVNEKTLEIFNLQGADYRGKNDKELSELAHPIYKDALNVCEITNEMAWKKGSLSRIEEAIPTPEGEERIFDVMKVPMFHPDGTRKGLLTVGRNIMELRMAEREKENLQAQLLHAQKLKAIGTLAGGVAHEFNNILANIQGAAELALLKVKDKSPVSPYLKQIETTIHRAVTLVNQLLLFSRKHPFQFNRFNPSETIRTLVYMLTRLIGENIQIECNLAEETWPIYGDKASLDQAITNLVINAKDAMLEKGSILIKTENVIVTEKTARAHVDAYPGAFVRISVSDNGVGMDFELQSHIFEPFFTTKDIGKGSGLGLSVVHGIVTQHRGWIDLESAPGKGSTFSLYFPAADQGPKTFSEKTQPPSQNLKGQSETILVVEDEETLKELLADLFESHGYRVLSAGSIREALGAIENQAVRPDLVFSDIMLPDGNGLQLCEDLRARFPQIKLLLTSGYPDPQTQEKEFKEHAIHFIKKPYKLAHLLSLVKRILTSA